jgi:hypothetical protein
MAINLRSPYYTGTAITGTAYATLDISIWEGSSASPVTAQYNLRKSIVGANVNVYFEISELIRDYLDITFDGNYVGQNVWVKTVQTVYNSSNVVISIAPFTQIAYDSYSYFEEPEFNIVKNSVLIDNREIFALEDNFFRVPINTKNNPSVVFYNNSEIVYSDTLTNSNNSSNQIKYISINGNDSNFDTYFERVVESGGTYEDNICIQSFINSYSIGQVDKIIVSADYYGNELIINGDFATPYYWSIEASDTISGGKLNISGAGERRSTIFAPITGKTYILTFDITDYTSGSISVYDGNSGVNLSGSLNATGTYTYTYTQTQTANNGLNFFVPTGFVGSIDNVSIVESFGIKTDTITVKTIEECKYEPKKFTFVNKFGALQDIYFFKKQVNKMDVTKESYNANTLNSSYSYNRSVHTKRDFNIKAKESFTFSSGYLSEEYNEVFKQMMLSEKVWITNIKEGEEQVLPINVKTSNITYKTSLNDRLVEYTIEFENSYNVLNDIR